MMKIDLKLDIASAAGFKALHELFTKNGFEIRMAGGAVRDLLSNKIPNDLDFCTNATPIQMLEMENDFWTILSTGIDHGTLTFMSLFGSFEVTTLRNDVETDGRHAKVEFTDSWQDDAARRDFTINAMLMDIDGNVFDWFNGQEDIKNNVVRFVGDADKRIKEDALRIMRFFRFVSSRNANFHSEDFAAIFNNKKLLDNVSIERIWDETKKAIKKGNASRFFELMHISGVAEQLGFAARTGSQFSVVDNIEDFCTQFPVFAIGAQVFNIQDAVDFAEKFKLSNDEQKQLGWFIQHKIMHSDHKNPFNFDIAENMVQEGVNREWIKTLAAFFNKWVIVENVDAIEKVEFPVTGNDLISIGFKQGQALGIALTELKIIWKESRFLMNKNDLMVEAKKFQAKMKTE